MCVSALISLDINSLLVTGQCLHVHAKVLTPSMFIAQLPQTPSLQLLRKVNVGSISFFIRMSASRTIGPVLFKSSKYVCILGFVEGVSGFQR